ncbi:hypothetical protein IFM89_038456 [Coptis chinensis]|uniref:Protein decapping 5 n=1 Tax=Coptis chinensis TaxID=261450 RepID=A0A835H9M9_9MAGN|nr:hypothetical protein IFM89_038456 [Coptis chinensis]
MAADPSRSAAAAGPADSYIGSLISLTSKSEIRYEGVLYNINTEESSIGLRNVKSFGTEGRKKDGPQVPPNDKVYEYILFRGSDIKDLQVKASPPVQPTPTIHEDPAIIQSHYSRPTSMSTSFPAGGSGSVVDPSSHTSQLGVPRSPFQGGLPLYQPGGSLGSWGSPPPPNANGSGLAVPMYWQGLYGHPGGLQHGQQQSMVRPPPGLSMPYAVQQPMQQPMQYPGMNPSFPTGTSNFSSSNMPSSTLPELPPLLPPVTAGALNLSSTMPSTLPSPAPTAPLAPETSPSLMPNKSPAGPTVALSSSVPLVSPFTTSSIDTNIIAPSTSNKHKSVPTQPLQYQTVTQAVSAIGGASSSSYTDASTPALITPGQLLQPGSATLSSSQSSQLSHKDVQVVQASSSEPPPSSVPEVQAPILPLPTPHNQKLNGAPVQNRYNYNYNYRGRERGRGRGNGIVRPVTKFAEEFDFMAMNEKFNKDEVWGHLGKANKANSRDKQEDGSEDDDEDDLQDEEYAGSSNPDYKPVYVKDDFFDTLSCNALDHGSRGGRTRFSEQMKIDTETFGDFSRHRGGRGGRGPGRGGRPRGGYYGRGYGYGGRGRGPAMSNRPN